MYSVGISSITTKTTTRNTPYVCNDNIIELKQPEENSNDLLTELLRSGAKELITQVVNAELEELLAHYADHKVDGKQTVIRNGFLPQWAIQTGLG